MAVDLKSGVLVSAGGDWLDIFREAVKLAAGLEAGAKHQTLLGVTGSGRTFTIANVIAKVNEPTLVPRPQSKTGEP